MTSRPMRKLPTTTSTLAFAVRPALHASPCAGLINPLARSSMLWRCRSTTSNAAVYPRQILSKRHLAQVRPEPISEAWFTSSSPRAGPADDLLGSTNTPSEKGNDDHKPPDERLIKLGKSIHTHLLPWAKLDRKLTNLT